MRILVVEDEPRMAELLRQGLAEEGHVVTVALEGREALGLAASAAFDLILLDVMLPGMDGLAVARRLRAQRNQTPILMLTARDAPSDIVEGLNLGADDYLTKPFGVEELLARVRVALRHAAGVASGTAAVFKTGDLEVDIERRRVRVGAEEVHLTPTEYDLLKTFVSQPDKVLTDRMLLRAVWGPEYGSEAHYLHVYVARLRRKIEKDPQRPRYLLTEPGVGYRLVTEQP
jgi:two-component system KDP operon response regulator KdpE